MGIGNLGLTEMLVIGVVVLILFGPSRMPEIARSLGHAMREFRRSLNQIQRELEEADPRQMIKDPLGLNRTETEERERREVHHAGQRTVASEPHSESDSEPHSEPHSELDSGPDASPRVVGEVAPADANEAPTDAPAPVDPVEPHAPQGEG